MTSTPSTTVPDSVAAVLTGPTLTALDAALGPPVGARAKGSFEVEIEAKGEGTFVVVYKDGVITAKKGFADAPLVAVQMPKDGHALLQPLLQAALDGFPTATPTLRAQVQKARTLPASVAAAALAAVTRLKPAAARLDIEGHGTFRIARGPVDEAEREVRVTLTDAQLKQLLAGAPPPGFRPAVSGDRGVLADVMTAFAPVLTALR